MNQVFNFNRWLALVIKHWSENRKKYLLSLGGLAALQIIWFGFCIVIGRNHPMHEMMQVITYYVSLILAGCFFASFQFSDLSSKSKGIEFLSLPASHFEKLLLTLLYSVVLFFISYTLVFYLVDIVMVKLGNAVSYSAWQHGEIQAYDPDKLANVFIADQPDLGETKVNIYYYIMLAYFAVQSAFILGSIYFPKFSFLKTIIALLIFVVLLMIFMGKILMPLFPPRINFNENLTSLFVYGDDYSTKKVVTLPEWIGVSIIFLFKYAFAPIFWLITYYRLKEKQI